MSAEDDKMFLKRIEEELFTNKVTVHPGDVVFGDIDGVVIIPHELEIEVVEQALKKVHGENMVKKLIQEGMPTRQVWDEYGVM